MSKDITTFFTRFSSYTQTAYHESFVTKNSIPWWNIDFNRSYVIQYLKRNSKEQFDFLQHTKQIPFFEFFDCKCGICTYLENNNYCSFYPHFWHYDNRHGDFQCLFRRQCDYFKLLQMFRNLKPDYEIFLWIKSFDCTGTTQYKNESQLL
ncbi:76_t:CDS:2, partial [Gigaspora rosea]